MDRTMSCVDAQTAIERLVDGAAPGDDPVASHVEGCARCSASLAFARRLDRLLTEEPTPAAPPELLPAVLVRVSRERWRSDQVIDRWFTFALVAGLLLSVGGLIALFNLAGLTRVVLEVVEVLSTGLPQVRGQIAVLLNYAAALAVVLTAYGVWWWTDGRFKRPE